MSLSLNENLLSSVDAAFSPGDRGISWFVALRALRVEFRPGEISVEFAGFGTRVAALGFRLVDPKRKDPGVPSGVVASEGVCPVLLLAARSLTVASMTATILRRYECYRLPNIPANHVEGNALYRRNLLGEFNSLVCLPMCTICKHP